MLGVACFYCMCVTVASATVAQSTGDVKLFCLVAFGGVDKYANYVPGRILANAEGTKGLVLPGGSGLHAPPNWTREDSSLLSLCFPFEMEFDSPLIGTRSKFLKCVRFSMNENVPVD